MKPVRKIGATFSESHEQRAMRESVAAAFRLALPHMNRLLEQHPPDTNQPHDPPSEDRP